MPLTLHPGHLVLRAASFPPFSVSQLSCQLVLGQDVRVAVPAAVTILFVIVVLTIGTLQCCVEPQIPSLRVGGGDILF
jgi:hypothetical protein